MRAPRHACTETSEEPRQEKPGCVQKTDLTIDCVSLEASSAHANGDHGRAFAPSWLVSRASRDVTDGTAGGILPVSFYAILAAVLPLSVR